MRTHFPLAMVALSFSTALLWADEPQHLTRKTLSGGWRTRVKVVKAPFPFTGELRFNKAHELNITMPELYRVSGTHHRIMTELRSYDAEDRRPRTRMPWVIGRGRFQLIGFQRDEGFGVQIAPPPWKGYIPGPLYLPLKYKSQVGSQPWNWKD